MSEILSYFRSTMDTDTFPCSAKSSTYSGMMDKKAEHGGKIRVCCRVRPLDSSREAIQMVTSDRCLHIQSAEYSSLLGGQTGSISSSCSTAGRGVKGLSRRKGRWGFTFDDVLEDGCSQEEVYRKCAKDILESVLKGVNGTIMAYGCTGAGKSYTMMGSEQDEVDETCRSGICARALRDIFREAARRRRGKGNSAITVRMSFVEIYNEQLFDLLLPLESCPSSNQQQRRFNVYGGNDSTVGRKRNSPLSSVRRPAIEDEGRGGGSGSGPHAPLKIAGTPRQLADLAIYERPDGSTYIKGLRLLTVSSEDEALRHLRCGQKAREVAENQFNHASSRSHAVLTVHLTMRGDIEENIGKQDAERGVVGEPERGGGGGGGGENISKLNLVDLAGSEKSAAGVTAADAVLHREGCFINKSLTFLEQVTIALADQTREHVPFRSSKLTHFLKVLDLAAEERVGDTFRLLRFVQGGGLAASDELKLRFFEGRNSTPDSLGGSCQTLMIACVWPRPDLLQQSLATLKFAARMRCVKNLPVVNERSWSTDDELSRLKKEVDQLKAQLMLKADGRAGGEVPTAAGNTHNRRRCLWEEAGRFVLEGNNHDQASVTSVGRRGSSTASSANVREGCDGRETCSSTTASEEGKTEEDRHGHRGNQMEAASVVSTSEEVGAVNEDDHEQGAVGGRQPCYFSSPSIVAGNDHDAHRQPRFVCTTGYAGEFVRTLRELVWEATAVAVTTSTRSTPGAPNVETIAEDTGSEMAAKPEGEGRLTLAAAVRSAVEATVERGRGNSRGSKGSPEGGDWQGGCERRPRGCHEQGRFPSRTHRNRPSADTTDWMVAAEVTYCEEFGRNNDNDGTDCANPSERPRGVTLSKARRAGGGVTGKVENKEGDVLRCRSLPHDGSDEGGVNTDDTATEDDGVTEVHEAVCQRGETSNFCCRHLGGAFEVFKNGEGEPRNSRLQEAKAAVKRARSVANNLAGRVNDAKGRIDSARAQLQNQQNHQQQGNEAEEQHNVTFEQVALLKRQKREYRVLFQKLAVAKVDLLKLQEVRQKELATLAAEFQSWQEQCIRKGSSGSSRSGSSSASFLPPLRPAAAIPSLASGGKATVTTTTNKQETRCGDKKCGESGGTGRDGDRSVVGGEHRVALAAATRLGAVVLQQQRAACF